jgi:hypothetical protein
MYRSSLVPRTYLVLLVLLLSGADLHAQASPLLLRAGDLAPGDRVRLELPASKPFTGTVVAFEGPSLVLRPTGADAHLAFQVADLVRLDVARGHLRGRSVLIGGGIGLLAGGALGAGWGWLTTTGQPETAYIGNEVVVIVGAMLLGGAGTILGAGIGALAPRTRWVRLTDR